MNSWDQPFIKQIGYKGGIIGLVRALTDGVPHYLIDAKFEPEIGEQTFNLAHLCKQHTQT